MRIIITGPTGAIGHALIELCISKGIEVLAICHRSSTRISQLPSSELVKVIELDADEYYEYEPDNTLPFDVFYHFAWGGTTGASRNDTDAQMRNIQYALDAVRLAQRFGCNTFIGAGSQAEYGRTSEDLKPGTPVHPENGYGIAKLCAGQMTRLLCNQLGIRHIWTRILSVYGPYDGENSMIISAIRKMIAGEQVQFTAGEQIWDYLYSSDAASAMLLIGQKGICGKTYIVSSGNCRRLKEYIEIIINVVNPDIKPVIGGVPYSDKQVMYLCGDISELTEDTGFVPSMSFDEGIQKVADYVRSTVF